MAVVIKYTDNSNQKENDFILAQNSMFKSIIAGKSYLQDPEGIGHITFIIRNNNKCIHTGTQIAISNFTQFRIPFLGNVTTYSGSFPTANNSINI